MTTDIFDHYSLTMNGDRLAGGIPRHPEIIRRWQETKWPVALDAPLPESGQTLDEATERTVAELGDQVLSEEAVQGIWTGFAEYDGQLVLENRNVKAMLKESANVMRPLLPKNKAGKEIAYRARLAETVFVHPRWIPLGVTEPSESVERPIHVMTARGPRTALKRVDIVEKAIVVCELRVLRTSVITEDVLRLILDHAAENGLGTDRSQGCGTFSYQLERLAPQS
jgi:hypothetical protein